MEKYIQFAEVLNLQPKHIDGVLYYVGEDSKLTIGQLSELYHYVEIKSMEEKKELLRDLVFEIKGKKVNEIPGVLKEYILGKMNSIRMQDYVLSHGRIGVWGKDLNPVEDLDDEPRLIFKTCEHCKKKNYELLFGLRR